MTTERMTTERTDDPLISQSEEAEAEARRTARAANLFDVRRLIGALFAVYGVILTILGIGPPRPRSRRRPGST